MGKRFFDNIAVYCKGADEHNCTDAAVGNAKKESAIRQYMYVMMRIDCSNLQTTQELQDHFPLPQELSQELLKEFGAPKKVGLCFVDADHTYGGVRGDFEALAPYCANMLFHDVRAFQRRSLHLT